MIKHGKIYPLKGNAGGSHLDPIRQYVTRGIADAKENVVLHPKQCDIKGAKRHNVEMCFIAKTLYREHKPVAVAVGRRLAYAVFANGVAVRMVLGAPTTKRLEEFDSRGRAHLAPIELRAVNRTW